MFFYFIYAITFITILLCAVYFSVIASYCYGWIKTKTLPTVISKECRIAVVIAVRNEEAAIRDCLNAIIGQTYPKDLFEIIAADDNSTDGTCAIVREISMQHPGRIKLIQLGAKSLSGKKNALREAIQSTSAELIVTTDGDCVMGKDWLRSIASFYLQTGAKMIAGPVIFRNEDTVFKKMQSLEMMALMASTCGSLHLNRGILCNGANFAYTKKVFAEVNGFAGIDQTASGDDILLMYKVLKKYKNGVQFLKNEEAAVYTHAKENVKEFIEQRKRWASKGFKALNSYARAVSLLVYLFNLLLVSGCLFTGFASINSNTYLPFFGVSLILFGIKCIIDFLLLFLAAAFFKKKKFLYLFMPEQFIYMIYVIIIGLLGSTGRYEWKGRTLN